MPPKCGAVHLSVNFGSSEAVFINVYKDLLFVLGVHADGDRSVVEKVHLHHGTELARADRFAHSLGHQFYKAVVEWNRDIVWCGVDPTGAVALLVAGHQGELGDDEYVAANIFDAEVHHAMLVVEDAESDNLLDEPLRILLGVVGTYSYKNEVPLPIADFTFPSIVTDACVTRCMTTLMFLIAFI